MAEQGAGIDSPRPRVYHHGDLRRGLLDAALRIIEGEGVARLTLRGAARLAGVSHAAPKHHFGDLRGLHCAIAEEGFRALHEAMRASLTAELDATKVRTLRLAGVAYVDFAVRHPGHFRAMFHPAVADRSGQPALEEAADAAYGLLLDTTRAAQEAGEIRAGDVRTLAVGAWSMVHGLAALAVDGLLANKGPSTSDPVALAGEIADLLYLGLRCDV